MKSYHFITHVLLMFLVATFACAEKAETGGSEATDAQAETADPNDWTTNKGVGPITEISLSDVIDDALVEEGQSIFTNKCSACHKPNKKYIGPAMAGILDRRTPEWTMNMILNPMKMVQEDPIAKDLLMEYNGTPMANQNLTEEEARAVLEYFRTLKSE